jgi:hypothetical protein
MIVHLLRRLELPGRSHARKQLKLVPVLFSDGKVHEVNIIMLFMAMDHEATERHCLKAAVGCLSCDCPENEVADGR